MIALHCFLRHKLKLLSKCSVFKARQYIHQFTSWFTLQTSDYGVIIGICVDSAPLATSVKMDNVIMT